jgi:transposase
MVKHSEQFKLQVVKQYLAGAIGFHSLAREHGVAGPMVRRWVEWYRLHGMAGLTAKKSHYNAELKLSVLQDMWENAFSQTQVAAKYNIRNPASIGIWERRYRSGSYEALSQPSRRKTLDMPAPTSKPEPLPNDEKSREDLLEEIKYLQMENAFLKKLEALAQAKKLAASKQRK